jgi:hypothetical protein
MARSVMMSNTTLQFLFHPNVFNDPEAEASRIVQLLLAAAIDTDRKEAFKQTFPIYVTKNRNIGKVHPPLAEIPGILDRFWDGAMKEYRRIFKIHSKLKDVVKLVMENVKRKKLELLKAEADQAQESIDLVPKQSPTRTPRRRSHSSDRKTITASSSKRSATWDAFVNKLHGMRPHKNNPPNVDGSESSDLSRVNSTASIDTQATDSDLAATFKPGVVETSIADLDGTAEGPDIFFAGSPIRIEQLSDSSGVPCEALRRMRFAKDGSFEAFISVNESHDDS